MIIFASFSHLLLTLIVAISILLMLIRPRDIPEVYWVGGGAILTESVYNLHGIGQLAADSIGRLDIVPILVIVMLTAFAVVALNALMDIVYAYLDPRIRLQ